MDDRPVRARRMFEGGHLCSQSVLATYGDLYGLDQAAALKIACGLGSGIARTGEVCGAVTGAVMVAGLAHGRVEPQDRDALETTYSAVRRILTGFAAKHGSINCRELLGCDISTPEARKEAEQKGLFATKCTQFVEDAARLVESICGLAKDS